jgi:hypothetical protein
MNSLLPQKMPNKNIDAKNEITPLQKQKTSTFLNHYQPVFNSESREKAVEIGTISQSVDGTSTLRMLLYPLLDYNGWVRRILYKEADLC